MFHKWYKPDWLYELLPYVYLATGFLTIITTQNALGTVSGLLLTSTGAAVWLMRRRYRSGEINGAGPASRQAATSESGSSLTHLVWRASFECGDEIIDGQHKNLVARSNDLVNSVTAKRSREIIQLILYQLIEDLSNHFAAEEKILADCQKPMPKEHLEHHRSILARTKVLSTSFQKGQLPAEELIGFIVYDVIAQHIIQERANFGA